MLQKEKERKGGREVAGEMERVKGGKERKKEERLRIMSLYLCPNGILHVV